MQTVRNDPFVTGEELQTNNPSRNGTNDCKRTSSNELHRQDLKSCSLRMTPLPIEEDTHKILHEIC